MECWSGLKPRNPRSHPSGSVLSIEMGPVLCTLPQSALHIQYETAWGIQNHKGTHTHTQRLMIRPSVCTSAKIPAHTCIYTRIHCTNRQTAVYTHASKNTCIHKCTHVSTCMAQANTDTRRGTSCTHMDAECLSSVCASCSCLMFLMYMASFSID